MKLTIRNLSIYRQDSLIVQNLSTQIPSGSLTTIIGPSGSGKSTLLLSLNRLIPSQGEIFLGKTDINTIEITSLRRRIGMVFQRPALFSGTVSENLSYGPSLINEALSITEQQQLLTNVGLDISFLDRNASTLSEGQQQRLSLARTLANKPEILLLDEPTAPLDPHAALKIEELITTLQKIYNMTVLWITHDLNQAKRVSDNTLLLVGGKLIEEGPNIFSTPKDPITSLFIKGELEEY